MSAITTHVLDTSLGKPAVGVMVKLARLAEGATRELGVGVTDADGRVKALLGPTPLESGVYRLSFATGDYYRAAGRPSFFEQVEVHFRVEDGSEHHHVPLLLSPFGYSTYRGS
jgi:5-hydroxyisourate hydrolase